MNTTNQAKLGGNLNGKKTMWEHFNKTDQLNDVQNFLLVKRYTIYLASTMCNLARLGFPTNSWANLFCSSKISLSKISFYCFEWNKTNPIHLPIFDTCPVHSGLGHWMHQSSVDVYWICLISLEKVNAHRLTSNWFCQDKLYM